MLRSTYIPGPSVRQATNHSSLVLRLFKIHRIFRSKNSVLTHYFDEAVAVIKRLDSLTIFLGARMAPKDMRNKYPQQH